MRIVNLATVSVDTTAGGTVLVSDAQMRAVSGAVGVILNCTVPISIVDGTALGTVANSSAVVPANIPWPIGHRSGPLRAITTGATSTVQVSIACEP